MTSYFSSNDCRIFINGLEVDEAYLLNYTSTTQYMPVYGWNKLKYDNLAQGPIIVSGNIIVNATVPNYLQNLITNTKSRTGVDNDRTAQNLEQLRRKIDLNIAKVLAGTSASIDPATTSRNTVALLELARLKKHLLPSGISDTEAKSRDETDDFIIEIAHKNGHVRIKSATLTGVSSEINGTGSNPVMLSHSFIAREVEEMSRVS